MRDFLLTALAQISTTDKKRMAEVWITRCAGEWLKPLLDRVDAPECRRLGETMIFGQAGDRTVHMRDLLKQMVRHEELQKEEDGIAAVLKSARALIRAIDRSNEDPIHIGTILRVINLAMRPCIPLVRAGGRGGYGSYNDTVYHWIVDEWIAAEEAKEHLLQCQDILEVLPKRSDKGGFIPVPVDVTERRV